MPFVLFVVEPFTPLAGQRERSRERQGSGHSRGKSLSCLIEMLDSEFCKRLTKKQEETD